MSLPSSWLCCSTPSCGHVSMLSIMSYLHPEPLPLQLSQLTPRIRRFRHLHTYSGEPDFGRARRFVAKVSTSYPAVKILGIRMVAQWCNSASHRPGLKPDSPAGHPLRYGAHVSLARDPKRSAGNRVAEIRRFPCVWSSQASAEDLLGARGSIDCVLGLVSRFDRSFDCFVSKTFVSADYVPRHVLGGL